MRKVFHHPQHRQPNAHTVKHVISYHFLYKLYSSVAHRTIKLFFIGCGERGKTTLLRRLRGLPEEKTARTEGIDIEDWHYSPSPGKLKFSASKPSVHFLAWDFAGQVQTCTSTCMQNLMYLCKSFKQQHVTFCK